jgi:hypothetical protein
LILENELDFFEIYRNGRFFQDKKVSTHDIKHKQVPNRIEKTSPVESGKV